MFYYQCHNQQETYKKFNISDYKFRQYLIANNLPTDKTNYGKHTQIKVKIVELDKEFDSQTKCAEFFIANNLCQTKKVECALTRIVNGIKNNKKVYGYTIIKC